jgi:hypothetical protein
LTDIARELICRSQVNFFPSTPACFRSPTNSSYLLISVHCWDVSASQV